MKFVYRLCKVLSVIYVIETSHFTPDIASRRYIRVPYYSHYMLLFLYMLAYFYLSGVE